MRQHSAWELVYNDIAMQFGLCNASATFERLMKSILRGLLWKTCLAYLDDIIVMKKTFEEHLKILKEVFQSLNDAKCHLFQTKVTRSYY